MSFSLASALFSCFLDFSLRAYNLILWRCSEPGLHDCLVDSVSECCLLLRASLLLSVPSTSFCSSFLFIPFPLLLILSKPVFLESWTPPVCVVSCLFIPPLWSPSLSSRPLSRLPLLGVRPGVQPPVPLVLFSVGLITWR